MDDYSGRFGDYCEKAGIALAHKCVPKNCESCGWNPEVNAKRRKQLQWYASRKLLTAWGKPEMQDIETIREHLEHSAGAAERILELLAKEE